MAKHLRGLTAPAKNINDVPSTYMVTHNQL